MHEEPNQDLLLFLDIEASSPDEDGYPVCMAWSNLQGEIQSVLIIPEDDWIDWDFSYRHSQGLTREHLFEQGLTALDAIKQMRTDLADSTVYVDGLDLDHEWLERLFDSFDMDVPFMVEPFVRLDERITYEQFLADREELLRDHGLSAFNAENNVYVMLQLAERLLRLE